MAKRLCPLCNQPLPAALDQNQIHARLHKLALPALAEERRRLESEYDGRVRRERELAKQEATKAVRQEIEQSKKRAEAAIRKGAELLKRERAEFERKLTNQREAAKRIAEATLHKEMVQNIRQLTRENEAKLDKLKAERERDRMRYEGDRARLQSRLDDLSRKLERQSGERLGEEGEIDLVVELNRAFPNDDIKRVGRGMKGADVVHHVMDGLNNLGRIVYESKNVSTWQSSFLKQAAKHRIQYETPYVMIVSRSFPRGKKDFCLAEQTPVVCPRMAVALASVMRDAIVEIGRLRLTGAGRDQKAHELLQYLSSDRFSVRFKGIAESIETLREQQRKERNWHENAWEAQSALHDQIEKGHREIGAQLRSILVNRRAAAIAARA